MKNCFWIILSFLTLCISCSSGENAFLKLTKDHYYFGDTLQLRNTANLNNIQWNAITSNFLVLDSSHFSLGNNSIEVKAQSQGKNLSKTFHFKIFHSKPEKEIGFNQFKEYPHNSALFTQGLLIKDDIVYETSGLYNKSKIVSYNLGSTEFLTDLTIDSELFAEGLTYFQKHFYMLTWKEGVILKLNENATKVIAKIPLPNEIKEGWGLTSDANHLYISNGTSTLFVLNPSLEIIQQLEVVGHQKIYTSINELEFHSGKIYANLWMDSKIIIINPKNGSVEGFINLSNIADNHRDKQQNVLNGIAFTSHNEMLITGKHWNKMYSFSLKD